MTRTKKLKSRMSGDSAVHRASSLLSKNLNVQNVTLYGRETWSDNLREENTVLWDICGCVREEVTDDWRKYRNEQLHDWY
jgi:hypothetical protein